MSQSADLEYSLIRSLEKCVTTDADANIIICTFIEVFGCLDYGYDRELEILENANKHFNYKSKVLNINLS